METPLCTQNSSKALCINLGSPVSPLREPSVRSSGPSIESGYCLLSNRAPLVMLKTFPLVWSPFCYSMGLSCNFGRRHNPFIGSLVQPAGLLFQPCVLCHFRSWAYPLPQESGLVWFAKKSLNVFGCDANSVLFEIPFKTYLDLSTWKHGLLAANGRNK